MATAEQVLEEFQSCKVVDDKFWRVIYLFLSVFEDSFNIQIQPIDETHILVMRGGS